LYQSEKVLYGFPKWHLFEPLGHGTSGLNQATCSNIYQVHSPGCFSSTWWSFRWPGPIVWEPEDMCPCVKA
jgi:hypothetical protein